MNVQYVLGTDIGCFVSVDGVFNKGMWNFLYKGVGVRPLSLKNPEPELSGGFYLNGWKLR